MQERLGDDKSIYLQICDMLETDILRDILLEEERVPSTNNLARRYAINPPRRLREWRCWSMLVSSTRNEESVCLSHQGQKIKSSPGGERNSSAWRWLNCSTRPKASASPNPN